MTDTFERDGKTIERHEHGEIELQIESRDYDCPNCSRGLKMYRPGSKTTCANCFWVVGSQYNDHVLADFDMTVPQARRLLAALGKHWHGTPGSLGSALRQLLPVPSASLAATNRPSPPPADLGADHD